MRGFEVVTSDDRVVGHVADVRDGYLIVESGQLRKARHPVPREFVHAVDEAAKAFVTVPRRVVMDAPSRPQGFFDRRERRFGLAESYIRDRGARRRSATIPPSRRATSRALAGRAIGGIRAGYRTEHRAPLAARCSATGTSTGAGPQTTRPTRARGSRARPAARGSPRGRSARRPRRA